MWNSLRINYFVNSACEPVATFTAHGVTGRTGVMPFALYGSPAAAAGVHAALVV
jgi:hypothetical protein